LAGLEATGAAPAPGQGITAGGSPRYQVYACADGQHVAVAPLEEKFWQTFCQLINLPQAWRAPNANPAEVQQAVAQHLATQPAEHWLACLGTADTCVVQVLSAEQARQHPQFAARGVFAHRVQHSHGDWAALPVPVAQGLRQAHTQRGYAELGASADVDWLR
jgi:crotonobetainyl-CoA:carnitine CoA-transferase CaiB-like acyl-CoA transferase